MLKYFMPLFCLFLVSCSNDDDSSVLLPNETSIADQILVLVNQHRQAQNLEVLAKNNTAEMLAIDHTRYMIGKGEISHDGFQDRGNQLTEKENANAVAENVASTYPTAEAVMEGWLNSTGHKNNIEGDYTHIGIAAIKDPNGTYYYTQLFFK